MIGLSSDKINRLPDFSIRAKEKEFRHEEDHIIKRKFE